MSRLFFSIISLLIMLSCSQEAPKALVIETKEEPKDTIDMKHLTYKDFRKEIFDFEQSSGWEFNGNTPIIIDFYADWCQPCKRLSPILSEIKEEYNDQILVYKVNIEDEPDLASACSVKSIPVLLFIPTGGKEPVKSVGLVGKNDIRSIIKEVFGISRP